MGQIQLTVALVMIGLFTVAIIGFAVNFAVDNNAVISVSDDPELTGLSLATKSNLSAFREETEDTYQSIIDTNIAPASNVAKNVGAFKITWTNSLGIVINILQVSYSKIFGSNAGFSVFLTALISVLAFMGALFIYKTLRGNPD